MLARRFQRLILSVTSFLIIVVLVSRLRHGQDERQQSGRLLARALDVKETTAFTGIRESAQIPLGQQIEGSNETGAEETEDQYHEFESTLQDYIDEVDYEVDTELEQGDSSGRSLPSSLNDGTEDDEDDYEPLPDSKDYREIFSLTTTNRKYFGIYLGGDPAYNPSLIPHPTRHDLWIVVAQHDQSRAEVNIAEEAFVCNAGFFNGILVCTGPPTILPVAPSIEGRCEGDIAYYNFRTGPRDSRLFYSPDAPYIVYGSQSSYSCLSIWLQDVRMLLKEFYLEQMTLVKLFKRASEVQRPHPWKPVEKNFFVFWDWENKAYIHHDIYPSRVFAQLSFDGSVGPDLAPTSAAKDGICMAKFMPTVGSEYESIHQATNSLAITLCQRSDPFCVPNDTNTFIMTIFQHKSFYDWHAVYEPYVMLFQRSAPFAIHAISQRPMWIHGRRGPRDTDPRSPEEDIDRERNIPPHHSEMVYITSMSWKTHGQKYHGYIDDPLFLAFGIEDSRPAAIDILAGDLLQDLGYCAH